MWEHPSQIYICRLFPKSHPKVWRGGRGGTALGESCHSASSVTEAEAEQGVPLGESLEELPSPGGTRMPLRADGHLPEGCLLRAQDASVDCHLSFRALV